MVLAHYFREDGKKKGYEEGLKIGLEKARKERAEKARDEAQSEIERVKAEAQAESDKKQADIDALQWRLNEVQHMNMQTELDDLRKRVDALEAARAEQSGE